MAKNIFVGNLPYSTTDELMRELFEAHGTVESAKVITDRVTGRSRGFGFVEMDDAGAEAAIAALNGSEIDGRPLRVDLAHERKND
jgi:cold-inducible RNA-binding protein